MSGKKISREKIIEAFLFTAFDKSNGGTSLADIADYLHVKKASLYNHFDSRDAIVEAVTEYSGRYLARIMFTPPDLKNTAQKYSPQTLLKGVVLRYFKLFERDPVYQIYTFLQSEKYFNYRALEILNSQKERVISGTILMLQYQALFRKIRSRPSFGPAAVWFANAVMQMLDTYLAERKETIRQNPESGAGSLFALPTDDRTITQVSILIDRYTELLGLLPAAPAASVPQ